MPNTLPVIDADSHVMEREVDIRKYLAPPWDRRTTGLVPTDQPWDDGLFGTLGSNNPNYQPVPNVVFRNGMSPAQQVEAWHQIMEYSGFEHVIGFPSHFTRVVNLREKDFQLAVVRA